MSRGGILWSISEDVQCCGGSNDDVGWSGVIKFVTEML